MDYITTTELRTKTKQLVKALEAGKSVLLLHRSKKIGILQGDNTSEKAFMSPGNAQAFKPESFEKDTKNIDLDPVSQEEIENLYRQAMEQKHVKRIS